MAESVGGVEVGSGLELGLELGMAETGEQREWIHRAGSWCGTWRAGVLLLALCLAVYLPGFFGIAAVDRDESRFAQASRQMLEAPDWHGWLVPRIQDRPRLNKPPLIYWLQAASAAVFTERWQVDGKAASARDAIWMYRVPSLVAGLVIVWITWRIGLVMYDSRVATLAAALLAVCPVFVWEAKQARADMVMVAATTASLWALWGLWSRRDRARTDWTRVLALWGAIGVGVMAKGPVPVLIVALSALTLAAVSRDWKWLWRLHAWVGVIVIVAMLGPWIFLVAREVGFDTYREIVWSETIGRSVEPKDGHWGPPGYHLLLMIAVFFPGSLLAALAIARASKLGFAFERDANGTFFGTFVRTTQTMRDARPAEFFLLCTLVPSWIMFELIGTKLPHYTMPLYPVLALACGRAVLAGGAGHLAGLWSAVGRFGVRVWSVLAVGLAVATAAVVYFAVPRYFGLVPAPSIIAVLVAPLLALVFVLDRAIQRRKIVRVQLIGVGIAVAASALIGLALPTFDELRVSQRLASHAALHDPNAQRPLGMLGYHEDSFIFETRGHATRIDPGGGENWLSTNPTGLLAAEEPAAASLTHTRELARVTGFNYSKGKRVTVLLLERAP